MLIMCATKIHILNTIVEQSKISFELSRELNINQRLLNKANFILVLK